MERLVCRLLQGGRCGRSRHELDCEGSCLGEKGIDGADVVDVDVGLT